MSEHITREVDAEQTARLKADAAKVKGTPLAYFLLRAAGAQTDKERKFWLNKVDSALYFEARKKYQRYLDQRSRENFEADLRLAGTEASVILIRTVGNACVLELQKGMKQADGYSLIRRTQGEATTEGYGDPFTNGQWVIQNLQMGVVHQFAVVSEDDNSNKEVQGDWLEVSIGSTTTAEIQQRERAEADRQYQAAEEKQRREQADHVAKVAARRKARAEAIKRQEEEARIERERIERERIAQEKRYELEKSRLHEIAPRDLQLQLRENELGDMQLDITFERGLRTCDIYQFQLNGSVMGYYPDGRHSGRKRSGHRYHRTLTVLRGRVNTLRVYGVNDWGDAGELLEIHVPEYLRYESGIGTLYPENVGGGRWGFAARTHTPFGISEVGGRYTCASKAGVLCIFQAVAPKKHLWILCNHNRLRSLHIDDTYYPVTHVNYTRGAGHLYRAEASQLPTRLKENQDGIVVGFVLRDESGD